MPDAKHLKPLIPFTAIHQTIFPILCVAYWFTYGIDWTTFLFATIFGWAYFNFFTEIVIHRIFAHNTIPIKNNILKGLLAIFSMYGVGTAPASFGIMHQKHHVQAAGSETLTLNLERSGESRRLTVQPRLEEGKGFLGVGPAYAVQRWGLGEAVGEAVLATWDKTAMTLGLVKKMVQGLVSTRNLSGPITIAKVAGDSAKSGVETFLGFLALLSVSLAVLNLLPIPVLDGGHVVLHVLEWVRGAPLPERVQALGVQVGLMLVVSLMALALINDFSRL